jgi:SHS2 domain-containing protein
MDRTRWRHFDHKADIGIEGTGPSMEIAFAQAGLALNAVISDLNSVRPVSGRSVECTGDDPELLFFDFINELIFLISTEAMLFSQVDVKIKGSKLEARLLGEAINPERHDPAVEVKGASFNGLVVRQDEKGLWIARCVVDV